ncbi:hypothetical protein Glove_341g5 [Diversispora epigaea]|uniref:Uncharacterized protein n=1 Tax=Diversispora epigaea TaxID=1348612 RepID=A0A397HKT5_9GLOM|nr:hypothetical protein Glove_341g5 [Diversispora epigaea]
MQSELMDLKINNWKEMPTRSGIKKNDCINEDFLNEIIWMTLHLKTGGNAITTGFYGIP